MPSVSIAALALLAASPLRAVAPGEFDPTFGGGAEVANFDLIVDASDAAEALALGPDGSMVLAGRIQTAAGNPGKGDLGLVRVGSDGALVDKWGTLGDGRSRATLDADATDWDEYLWDVAVDAGGKVIGVGGRPGDIILDPYAFAIRLNSNGTPDSTFAGDGRTFLDFDATAIAVGVDSENRGVVGATRYDSIFLSPDRGFGTKGYVYRLATVSTADNDVLDTDFAADGLLQIPGEEIVDLLVLPDDRVLVATSPQGSLIPRLHLLMANGLPDKSFGGGDGIVDLDISQDGFLGRIVELALDPRGRIVLLGWFNDPDKLWVMARVHPGGAFDTTFGFQGVAAFGYDNALTYTPRGLAVQSDGRIVVVGDDLVATISRFDALGALDTTFYPPNGGRTFGYETPTDQSWASAVAIGLDGRIVIAGSSINENDFANRNFGVARLESGVVFCDGFESQAIYGKSRWSTTAP